MKKRYLLLFVLILLLPLVVYAKKYDSKDLTISLDDSMWYVFTRDNIKDNKELEEFGITYDYINNFMNTNDVYMDAVRKDISDKQKIVELFVVIKKVEDVSNLHTYSSSDINKLGESLKDKVGASTYDIYSVGKYKYVHVKYYDSSKYYYIDQYYTVINGYGYNIMSQKPTPFVASEEAETKKVVDTTEFKIESSFEKNSSNDSLWINVVIGAIVGGVIGGIGALVGKKKKQ